MTPHTNKQLVRISTLAVATWLANGCGGGGDSTSPPVEGAAQVRGHLDSDGGNQHVSPWFTAGARVGAGVTARVVTAVALASDGDVRVLARASVAADGSFELSVPAPQRGQIVLRVGDTEDGPIAAQVLVPAGVEAGATVVAVPASHETTVEAEAFGALVRSGVDAEAIDTIGLTTRVSAELAANVATGAGLSTSLLAAQRAELATAGAVSGRTSLEARELVEARAAAFARLAAALDAGGGEAADVAAWDAFLAEAAAAVSTQLGVAGAAQSAGANAAAFAFDASLAADASAPTADAAQAVAMWLGAHAAATAQLGALAGLEADTRVGVEARLRAAYAQFFATARAAVDLDGVAAAGATLAAVLTGRVPSSPAGTESVLDALVEAHAEATGAEAPGRDEIDAAFASTLTATAELAARLQVAATATDVAATTADAFVRYHAALDAALGGEGGADLGVPLAAFVREVAALAESGPGALIELGARRAVLTVTGEVLASIGLQAGADAMAAGLTVRDMRDAIAAQLLALGADGGIEVLAAGAFDAEAGTFTFVGVPRRPAATAIARLVSASGVVLGAAALDRPLDGSGTVETPGLTPESTVEAEVLLQRVAAGAEPGEVDTALIVSLVDGPLGAATLHAGAAATVARAVSAAQRVQARVLETTDGALHDAGVQAVTELQAQLRAEGGANADTAAEAHAAFEETRRMGLAAATGAGVSLQAEAAAHVAALFAAVVDARSSGVDGLAAVARARARLHAASALRGSLEAALREAGAAGGAFDALDAAFEAHARATARAEDAGEQRAAGEALVRALIGDGHVGSGASGVLETHLRTRYEHDVAVHAAVDAALAASVTASETLRVAVETAARSAGAGSIEGAFDASAAAAATVAAFGEFGATLDLPLTVLRGTAGLSSADAALVARFAMQVSAGLFASAAE